MIIQNLHVLCLHVYIFIYLKDIGCAISFGSWVKSKISPIEKDYSLLSVLLRYLSVIKII